MRRDSFVAGAAAALLAAPTVSSARPRDMRARASLFADPSNGQWGAVVDVREVEGIQPPISPRLLDGTIFQVVSPHPDSSRAVTLTNLPAVMQQGVPGHVGSPGSCEADSFGYGLGAYTAARRPDGSMKWDAADPHNAPSAAWLYQWEHSVVEHDKRVCPAGSGATPYANRLVRNGAPSVADFPYDPHDAATPAELCSYITSLPVTSAPGDQSRLIVGSYKAFAKIKHGKATYLAKFKELLRHGHAIAFTGLVAKKYGTQSPPLTNGAFTAPAGFSTPSGHGQVIVGYDDGVGPHGAFLVQNSFGTAWNPGSGIGHNGRIYWDYDAFFASQSYAIVMFPNTDEPVAGTMLAASVAGAPRFAIKSAHVAVDDDGRSQLVLVTHASDGLAMKHLAVTPPSGAAVHAKLNAMMRLGYQYVQGPAGARWGPGTYAVAFAAQDRANRRIVYRGSVRVT